MDGDAEVSSRRVPACEDSSTIQTRLAELQREREAARGWEEPAPPLPDPIKDASDAICAAWEAALSQAHLDDNIEWWRERTTHGGGYVAT